MDLRSYYKKVRDEEAMLKAEHLVVVSLETSEGGKAGVSTEVPRAIAARLIAETRARVATDAEASEFHNIRQAAKRQHELDETARRVQVVVIPAQDLQKAHGLQKLNERS